MNIEWSENAWEDFTSLIEDNEKTSIKKIIKLIKDISRNGNEKGIGKPEQLKHELSGYWSRSITDTDRLVYKLESSTLYIISCKTHYHK